MRERYKMILSSKRFYRELELGENLERTRIGTEKDCDVRFYQNLFLESFYLDFYRDNDGWTVDCSDNVYLSQGEIQKYKSVTLRHGTEISLMSETNGQCLLRLEFLIDFFYRKVIYERAVDLSQQTSIEIGCEEKDVISLSGPYVSKDRIRLVKQDENLVLFPKNAGYGLYVNDKRVKDRALLPNHSFFSLSDYSFYFADQVLWTEIRPDLAIHQLSFQDFPIKNSYPEYHLNTRIRSLVNTKPIKILDPPTKDKEPRTNLLVRLLPTLMLVLMAGFMMFLGQGMIIFAAVMGLAGFVTAILTMRDNKKQHEEKLAHREEVYTAYIDKKKAEIEQARREEREVLEDTYPSQDLLRQRWFQFSSSLFDRRPEDDDFLSIRLGTGEVPAERKIEIKDAEKLEIEDELELQPEKLKEHYEILRNAPVVLNMNEVDAAGIIGDFENRYELLKNMVLDVALRQDKSAVKIAIVASPDHRELVEEFRWLPHLYPEEDSFRLLICDEDSKNVIYEWMYKQLSARQRNDRQASVMVFFFDPLDFKTHPLSKFLKDAKDLNFHFVFFADQQGHIPEGCSYLVFTGEGYTGQLVDVNDGTKRVDFQFPTMDPVSYGTILRRLAPIFTKEISLQGSLTDHISLFELMNVLTVSDVDLATNWASSNVAESMSVPVGVNQSGIVSLDLHDTGDGPHGLVAGTTGSGKSELLQTYLMMLATRFHPYEIAFLIIDFKGGGMANQFRSLPHLTGTITNIEGKTVERSLRFIKAELEKRQRLFARQEVNHIDKYIECFRRKETAVPLPHLIIVVDEFAELKQKQPEFMKELISTARIGRSLGVHMILATQKPAGQVNDQIWSNSRLRICLKVQERQDSNEVIHSPLAAEIKEPGRAYLQVGNNERFELFQSAYSGAPEVESEESGQEFKIYQLSIAGQKKLLYQTKTKEEGGHRRSQLEALVEYIAEYSKTISLDALSPVFLPPLEEKIPYPREAAAFTEDAKLELPVGVYDDPDHQKQDPYALDLMQNNVLLTGSAQMGKTNFLLTVIRSLAESLSPKQATIFIIDYASMALTSMNALHHVGGVVTQEEDQKFESLMKLLIREVEERKQRFIQAGVNSYQSYLQEVGQDLSHIFLVIDGLSALRQARFMEDDRLLYLLNEGVSLGITIVAAAPSTHNLSMKYLGSFQRRMALFNNDPGEYNMLFSHCRERLEEIPGRGLLQEDKRFLEVQFYRAFSGESASGSRRAWIAEINEKYGEERSMRIPVIPAHLYEEDLEEYVDREEDTGFHTIWGLDFETVDRYAVDLAKESILGIVSSESAVKVSWIRSMVHQLGAKESLQTQVYLFDGINRELYSLREEANVTDYQVSVPGSLADIDEVVETVRERYETYAQGDFETVAKSPLLVLVINQMDLVRSLSEDPNQLDTMKKLISRYRNMNIWIVISCLENRVINYQAPELLRVLRDEANYLYFDHLRDLKICDLPLKTMRQFAAVSGDEEAFHIHGKVVHKLKTVKGRNL